VILGIGIDLVEIARVADEVARYGDTFVESFLSSAEIADCRRRRFPAPSYAARFAAKEACAKALGVGVAGGLAWHDIQIRPDDRGAPQLQLGGEAERLAKERGVDRFHLSMTHERDYAIAVVVAEG